MEKTSPDLADLLDGGVARIFYTPFEVSLAGVTKYYAITNQNRTHYQDHKPEAMLFLAYMKHNPPQVPLPALDTFFKSALAFYENNTLEDLKKGLVQIPSQDRDALSSYLSEKFAFFSRFPSPMPVDVTKDNQGFGHHLSHALNPLIYALWNCS
jgi:hypothetical protein